ncbi:hypothetical protein TNIN_479781 [Trichonephila inaurata madagascariensis]|uniref:Uncharacterized protein n=1 Tax=Trichonephila inaurata madagascariensis TaxID=2747483 RepID=A0A8X6Y891_9ARAC|nr:hypothetical protein TNIN_479781 [Trichonephila inaurata madagascariensis]
MFVPLPGATVWPRTPYIGEDQTTTVPVVGSFSVWKICQVLDLPALDPPLEQLFFGSHKPYQLGQAFELCKALDLKVKLAPQ